MADFFKNIVELTWLVPALPLLAFGLILLTGKKGPGKGAYIAITAIVLSFILSMLIVGWTVHQAFSSEHFEPFARSTTWAVVGGSEIRMGFVVDQLAAMMLVVVTVVTMLVQIYSVGYMHGDPRYSRFFAYLSLFGAAMLALVLADNLLLFFMCWEIVGLTSYLLIGFWFEKPSAMRAAKKAFIVTRVGDVGLLLGMLLIFWKTRCYSFHEIFAAIQEPAFGRLTVLGVQVLPLAGLLLFMGAVGKSAQFPLHVWLPDAMEGPTPVSALIHAATMVAAGVYLVGRMYPVFAYEPHSLSLQVVAIVGCFTAFFAATIATVMNDIKRVLAYSTISQLGYMMLGLGLGPAGYTAGLFHLMTHAFFKANLFLGSGSVIHGTGTQDIQEMGGLARKMPKTYWTFLIATAALAGLPFTAGFFSKDEILLEAFHANRVLFAVALAAAFLTAFYMTRLVALTFWGEPRRQDVHVHESPPVMTVPLTILALLSIFAGWVGWPGHNLFHHFVNFAHAESHPFSWLVAGLATGTAGLGILLGWAIFERRVISPSIFRQKLPWVYNLLVNKYYIDEIYWTIIVKPLFAIVRFMGRFDQKIIDGVVNGIAYLTVVFSVVNNWIDKWVVDFIVNLIGGVTKLSGRLLRFVQTGVFQDYALIMFLGIIFIVWVYLLR
jgi:NADH-quinone oxidoreductase subunit L